MKALEDCLAEWTLEDPFYDRVLGRLREKPPAASLRSGEEGCAAGIPLAKRVAQTLGVEGSWKKQGGDWIQREEEIAFFRGNAEQILKFENLIIGLIGKSSGIATAAREVLAPSAIRSTRTNETPALARTAARARPVGPAPTITTPVVAGSASILDLQSALRRGDM
jgi:nicotinate-nucleotide pyrophosphorylase